MPKFSKRSLERLDTCDDDLITLCNTVIKHRDCTVVCGHRTKQEQDDAYYGGKSKLKFPQSKHNTFPSKAVDLAPYIKGKGIVWDVKTVLLFAGYVLRVADELGIKIRYGGDWNSNSDVSDENFVDAVHFELID